MGPQYVHLQIDKHSGLYAGFRLKSAFLNLHSLVRWTLKIYIYICISTQVQASIHLVTSRRFRLQCKKLKRAQILACRRHDRLWIGPRRVCRVYKGRRCGYRYSTGQFIKPSEYSQKEFCMPGMSKPDWCHMFSSYMRRS